MRKILVFLILASLLLTTPVMAADQEGQSDLMMKIDQLSQELNRLKQQMADMQNAAPVGAVGKETAGQPARTPGEGLNAQIGEIKLKFSGFIEAASIYRNKNLENDVTTPFQSLPLANSGKYYQDEVRFTARQSRLALLATTDYSPTIHLGAYYEMDFLGAAQTANSNESNSYNPRIRHLYATADWDDIGLHLLGGQTWSLTTMNNMGGIKPREEVTPLTIDAQYVVGFTWTRQPQFRIVKDWDKNFWLALSVENPATTVSASTVAATTLSQAVAPGNLFNSANTLSANNYPDFVAKLTWEPSWAHFEIFDMIRTFESTVASGTTAGSTVSNKDIPANSFGGGVIVPIVPGNLKLQLSGQYGIGIGRYGSAQLPDVTEDKAGNIHPLTELRYLTGLVWDPNKTWNVYGYFGEEQVKAAAYYVGTTPYGYGESTGLNNSGCGTYLGTCTGQVRSVYEGTVGVWWKFYQGKFGKMMYGVQYAYANDKYFNNVGGAPNANVSEVFTSFRFYW